ncbi:MAG: acyl carrier protein [Eubacteriales bacterium]|nr:acyl carrier protein [Eubacteriales bacterium]
MFEKVRKIIADQLGISEEQIGENTSFAEDLGADSLDLFELVSTLEDEYGIEIPGEELEALTTVGKVVDYLKEQGANG